MRNILLSLIIAIGLVLVCGCGAPPVKIPPDARLIFLGEIDPSNWNFSWDQKGELYFYDEQEGCIVLVSPTSSHETIYVPPKHKIRVYFVPEPSTRPS